jgi:DNA-binding NarL/FixJ family response regulator
MSAEADHRPYLRLAMAQEAPILVAGLRALLALEKDLVLVDLPATEEGLATVDVVLYDPAGSVPAGCGPAARPPAPVLVAFSWSTAEDVVARARTHGAGALLSKELDGPRLAESLRAVRAGRLVDFVVAPSSGGLGRVTGDHVRLTPRESEILQLITEGYSNDEIAGRLYLSINSIKTYIRSAYRKIGVTRRPQAVLWGVHHGFAGPDDGAGTQDRAPAGLRPRQPAGH